MVPLGPASAGPLLWQSKTSHWNVMAEQNLSLELGTGSTRFLLGIKHAGTNMTDPRHYSRWRYPWGPEDEWGPLAAAVLIFIILGGLIIYGSANL
jgi:hypothetical protein